MSIINWILNDSFAAVVFHKNMSRVVPTSWLETQNTCFLPKVKDENGISNLVRQKRRPDSSWIAVDIEEILRIFCKSILNIELNGSCLWIFCKPQCNFLQQRLKGPKRLCCSLIRSTIVKSPENLLLTVGYFFMKIYFLYEKYNKVIFCYVRESCAFHSRFWPRMSMILGQPWIRCHYLLVFETTAVESSLSAQNGLVMIETYVKSTFQRPLFPPPIFLFWDARR